MIFLLQIIHLMKKAMLIDRMKSIDAKGSTDAEFKGVRFKEEGEAEPLSETLSVSH